MILSYIYILNILFEAGFKQMTFFFSIIFSKQNKSAITYFMNIKGRGTLCFHLRVKDNGVTFGSLSKTVFPIFRESAPKPHTYCEWFPIGFILSLSVMFCICFLCMCILCL